MSSYLPPVFRGKIPTTSGRLLLAAVVMLAVDIPFYALVWERSEIAFFLFLNFMQVLALIGVLLFSPRRWVALLLMLPVSFFFMPMSIAEHWERFLEFSCAIVPLLLGVFTAWPRPRKRWVYVDEDDEDADSPAH